jgi:sec-independent protein translocase protein TatC
MESSKDNKMSLTEHLIELRKRLLRIIIILGAGFLVCFYFKDFVFEIITKPITQVLPADSHLVYIGVTVAFFVYMKLSFFAALMLTSPLILYQIWRFISPGLLPKEKRYVVPFVFFSTLLFLGGIVFGYVIVLPPAFKFFISFNNQYLQAMISFREYLSLFVTFLLGFGLSFELPVFIFFLTKLGIVNAGMLIKQWKFAILFIFIIAAALTPSPDALSQILMAIPLMFLYLVSIFVAKFAKRQKIQNSEKKE